MEEPPPDYSTEVAQLAEDALTLECLRWDNEIALEGEPYYWLRFPITPYSAGYLATFY